MGHPWASSPTWRPYFADPPLFVRDVLNHLAVRSAAAGLTDLLQDLGTKTCRPTVTDRSGFEEGSHIGHGGECTDPTPPDATKPQRQSALPPDGFGAPSPSPYWLTLGSLPDRRARHRQGHPRLPVSGEHKRAESPC